MSRTIKEDFKKWGGVFLETPVFETTSLLLDKYGEDEKLIFDLQRDQDGEGTERCSLRYDLTVPLSRYVAMNRKTMLNPFRAARFGRVYRRDQPNMTDGRYREFWQYDFDIVRNGRPSGDNQLELVADDCEGNVLSRSLALACFAMEERFPSQSVCVLRASLLASLSRSPKSEECSNAVLWSFTCDFLPLLSFLLRAPSVSLSLSLSLALSKQKQQ